MKIHARRQQRGVVLVVALIFLLILTLLGINAMDTTVLETKMAANTQEVNHAFQTAEVGLLEGMRVLNDSDALTDLIAGTTRQSALDQTVVTRQTATSDTIQAQTMPNSSNIRYLGRFRAPPGSGTSVASVYYEVSTTATADSANPKSQVTLRRGIMQLVPKAQ